MIEQRLDRLIGAAKETGFTIDYLEALTHGLSRQASLKVIGNMLSLPAHMKSSDNPWVRRQASAYGQDL